MIDDDIVSRDTYICRERDNKHILSMIDDDIVSRNTYVERGIISIYVYLKSD